MELRLPVASSESGYGAVCRSWARTFTYCSPPSSPTLSFRNSFRNPFRSSLCSVPPVEHEKLKKKASITARIVWERDSGLDDVILRQKKLKFFTKLRDLLVKQPDMCMSLGELSNLRKRLGLTESRKLVILLKRYSTVFELFEEGAKNLFFRLSPAAEELFLEEQKLKAEMESLLVNKIRKLLMMSIDKTLLIFKVAHLKWDLGLPFDFKKSMLHKYPEYFKVIELESGPALELTSWDPELAISTWQKNVENGSINRKIRVGEPYSNVRRRKPPKNFLMKRKAAQKIRSFHQMSYFSPYSDFTHLEPTSKEAERHACAVIHEILSMTIEKRVNIDFLAHFRRDYKFSQQVRGMLLRHPDLFYVCLKGDRPSVFLREGYQGSELIHKDPLVVVKEKLITLIAQGEGRPDDQKDDGEGDVGEADFLDDDDASADAEAEGWSSNIDDSLRRAISRRPLNAVQEEEGMPALVVSAERW